MSDKLETLASIRDELRKELIFGIEARPPIALILGFSGYSHQVMPLTQKLQHATRAYVINANGLSNFICSSDIAKILKDADEAGQLERAKKYQ